MLQAEDLKAILGADALRYHIGPAGGYEAAHDFEVSVHAPTSEVLEARDEVPEPMLPSGQQGGAENCTGDMESIIGEPHVDVSEYIYAPQGLFPTYQNMPLAYRGHEIEGQSHRNSPG